MIHNLLNDTVTLQQQHILLLNKLNINQVVAGCKKLWQKEERSSTFCIKICTCCAFYWPKANLSLQQVT